MKIRNRLAALLLCVTIGATLAACGNETKSVGASGSAQDTSESESLNGEQIANPWVENKDQADAQEQAGFSMELPSTLPEGYESDGFQVIPGEILEADYVGKDEAKLCIRKATGTDDPSGDYNEYNTVKTITVEDVSVTIKGDGDTIYLAVWNNGSYAWSIGVYNGTGLTQQEMERLIAEVLE